MIKLYSNSTVYVMCSAGAATGGPELLHQFAYLLRENGVNAILYYTPNNMENPVHEAYVKYNVPYVREIEDKEENVLVVCELYDHIMICQNYKNIRKCLWWLSVDNFFLSRPMDNWLKNKLGHMAWVADSALYRFIGRSCFDLPHYVVKQYSNFTVDDEPLLKGFICHFYQSEYARQTLQRMKVSEDKIFALSDYLNQQFIEDNKDFANLEKKDIVLYYPRKGKKFTGKLIREAQNKLNFVPIKGLTRTQMIDLLRSAKVYIDFGHHPGKDRIPREAAICKCCVITGKRGAAANDIDIPIPSKYKFDESSIPQIIQTITDCVDRYEDNIVQFEGYCKSIINEYSVFKKQVDSVFDMPNE